MTELITADEARRLREAATQGEIHYGPTPDGRVVAVTVDDKRWVIDSPSDIWVVYQNRDDGGVYLAITGDGPTSEANAALFAAAPGLAVTVEALDAEIDAATSRADKAEAEVRRLRDRLTFLDAVDDDPDSEWCDRHPRRVEAATAGMIGRDWVLAGRSMG